MASPNMVTTSDLARGRSLASSASRARLILRKANMTHFFCDSKKTCIIMTGTRMYAQLVETEELRAEERAFQDRIDAGIKIEPNDSMPDAYRKTLIRQISQHA